MKQYPQIADTIKISRDSISEIVCPFKCDAVPHIIGVSFGKSIPPTSTSGPGLIIEYMCENLHHWQTVFEDHSGGTWLSLVRLENLKEDPTL